MPGNIYGELCQVSVKNEAPHRRKSYSGRPVVRDNIAVMAMLDYLQEKKTDKQKKKA